MKKIFTTVLIALLAAAAINAIWRFGFRKSIPDAPLPMQVKAILAQNDCYVCHSQSPKIPFYASFPVLNKMMDAHTSHAVKFIDLETDTQDPDNIGEVPLAMIEHAVTSGSMPIFQYKMIHWGTSFNNKEKRVLSAWIKDSRNVFYSNGLSAEKHLFGVIQPIQPKVKTDPAKVDLGRRMFFDGRISTDGTISCASCHLIDKGGAGESDARTSEGINGQFGGVNAPTVYNAYFNVQQFWNGRAANLQEQAAGPPVNPVEMGTQTWDDIVSRLSQDKTLVNEFKQLYPEQGLTQSSVTDVIAEFEKTLITPGSRFDKYLQGHDDAISAEELKGFEAFKDNCCANCHVGVILGGQSFEYLGIFGDYFADRSAEIKYNGDDDGLKGFTGKDSDLHKFKVPGLRNVELTAPYFHDGTMATLEDAVRAMAKYELGKTIKDDEVNAIVAFMKTLTGKNKELALGN